MCKNVLKGTQLELAQKTGCEVVNKVKYLGIQIMNKNIDLYNNYYIKLWTQIDQDIKKWNNMKLSLFGRISIIKMNVLPRLMYLLQNIRILKNTSCLELWQRKVMKFIWAGKKARIKLKIMCDSCLRGSLQVPNFKIYCEAICLSWISKWISLQNKKTFES